MVLKSMMGGVRGVIPEMRAAPARPKTASQAKAYTAFSGANERARTKRL